MAKRNLGIFVLILLFCTCMTLVVRAEEIPTGFIFPTQPDEQASEETPQEPGETFSTLPGPRQYRLTMTCNGLASSLASIRCANVKAVDGDTGWISCGSYGTPSVPDAGTAYGLTGRVYLFEEEGAQISRVMIALPEEPVPGKTYRISASGGDAGLGLQMNDLICFGTVQRTETRVATGTKRVYDTWNRTSRNQTYSQYRRITDCFRYTYALSDPDDYFLVTVREVTGAYEIICFEGRLNGGLNIISGEFCCMR